MGEQEHSWSPAHVLTRHRACAQCYLCAAQGRDVQSSGEKHANIKYQLFSCWAKRAWKVRGIWRLWYFATSALACCKTSPAGSSQTQGFYYPDCHAKSMLEDPAVAKSWWEPPEFHTGQSSHKTCYKPWKHFLVKDKKSLFKCKPVALILQRHCLTFKEVLQSAALHGFTHPLREQMKKQTLKRTFIKRLVPLQWHWDILLRALPNDTIFFFLLWWV